MVLRWWWSPVFLWRLLLYVCYSNVYTCIWLLMYIQSFVLTCIMYLFQIHCVWLSFLCSKLVTWNGLCVFQERLHFESLGQHLGKLGEEAKMGHRVIDLTRPEDLDGEFTFLSLSFGTSISFIWLPFDLTPFFFCLIPPFSCLLDRKSTRLNSSHL